MQNQKPKRISTKGNYNGAKGKMAIETIKPNNGENLYILPEAKLDLEFFLKRGERKYTADEVIGEIFGEEGFRMTEQEKVYSVLKALEDLELAMPFEFECPKCKGNNPIAVEVAKVMKSEGVSKERFVIAFDDYIFEFDRPEVVKETIVAGGERAGGLAEIGMYMMQWLIGHNQGPDFEFIHLSIGTIIKLAKEFSRHMFSISFEMDSKCAHCKSDIHEEFGVSMDDIAALVNEL